MSYYSSKKFAAADFNAAIEKVSEALKSSGFGIITTIDMKATLKNKIDVDFKPYTILGACNPKFAHHALQNEENIGVFLPCNVVVKEADNGFEAVAVDPVASMMSVKNDQLPTLASEVNNMLENALKKL